MVMVFPPCLRRLRRSRSNDNAQDRPATAIAQGAYACPDDRELPATSGLPLRADIVSPAQHVSLVPITAAVERRACLINLSILRLGWPRKFGDRLKNPGAAAPPWRPYPTASVNPPAA